MQDKRHKILFVEDDEIDLMAFERSARGELFPYDYVTARSAKEASDILGSEEFDAVVTDFSLGDGTAFDLIDRAKDTPIIIVTGAGDEEIAVQAMRSGACDYLIKDIEGNYLKTLPATVENAIKYKQSEDELKRYREHLEELVKERTAKLQAEIEERGRVEEELEKHVAIEKELLSKTLIGCVKILTEILSKVNSVAFHSTSRVTRYVRYIATKLQYPDRWQLELAAMLSHIGCVALPLTIIDKVYSGNSLSDEEQVMYSSHPTIGSELVATIPRLESVARIIADQQRPFFTYPKQEDMAALGSQILKIAIELDQIVVVSRSHPSAMTRLRKQKHLYNPRVLAALESLRIGETFKFYTDR